MTPKEQALINYAHYLNTNPWVGGAIGVAVLWTLIWKGIALWKAARNGQSVWYVIMLIVNTVGILEIIYILFFSKPKQQNQ